MKKEYKIYLFRHGQTTYNKKKIFTGWKNPPLTKLGIKQAKYLAEKLKNKKFQIAIQTSLSRSKDTLKYVLKYHPECKRIITDNRIIERSYGELEGTKHKQFIKTIGKQLYSLSFKENPIKNSKLKNKIIQFLGENEFNIIHRGWDNPPPKGESFKMVEKRVKDFIKYLKKLIKKEKTNIVISAHGNSIRLFRKIMENASIEQATKWNIPYDKVFVYKIKI